MSILKLENVSKYFGDFPALRDVNLEVGKGELVVILGPSGSGKSTLLRIIGGLERPTTGKVLIDGIDVTWEPPYNRPTSMVFQDLALFPHLNVFENIAFGLRIRKMSEDEVRRRVKEAADLLKIGELLDRNIGQISGGQRQRVALARSLVLHPEILLLDEPLGALDLKLRKEMWIELKRLQRKVGNTWIFVTHDQEEALTLADKIAVINEGVIQQVGPKEEVYNYPVNKFVADFIGEMNFFEGKVRERNGGWITVELKGINVKARAGEEAKIGERVLVAIRPEKIILSDSPSATALKGRVAERNFVGITVSYEVELMDGKKIKVRALPRGRIYDVGEVVYVRWEPEDARVYVE